MSWQLASFAVVIAALAGAGWWYERSRPGPKLLAVVATLAALAALGRDAFAAIPDVKPTTAIVLVAGVAFGAAPGFAVGAIAALASNVLLGEGPWTPWQMLGWGLVGVLGGALAALAGRRLPGLAIALAAALAAELFNLLLDLYTWIGTGAHTPAGFAVVLGSALPFDVTHVIASFAFGLAFGGTLLRMLLRLRARMNVTWEAPGAAGAGLLALALLMLAAPPSLGAVAAPSALAAPLRQSAGHSRQSAGPSRQSAGPSGYVARARAYLERDENVDGGFGAAPGERSSEIYTAWGAIGLAAAGRNPREVLRDGRSPLDALRSQARTLSGAGDLERTILALRACGAATDSLAGFDPLARLLARRSRDGSFEDGTDLTAFGILALRAAGYAPGAAPVRAAAAWMERQQEGDGGFGFAIRSPGAGASEVDSTGAALQALAAAGVRSGSPVARAVAFLRRAQNADGGFPQQPGGESNAQSTAWAAQGLDAVGVSAESMRRGSRSPIGYLEGLLQASGAVRYSRHSSQTPVWVTAEALPALAARPFPI